MILKLLSDLPIKLRCAGIIEVFSKIFQKLLIFTKGLYENEHDIKMAGFVYHV